ncbi:MAG: hypothetical protein K1X53_10260 [Candidatus Sumerlaeaceae bacterium]|nr:hypothetical protein [Candidatus Sumerlaeaceae bacterium]
MLNITKFLLIPAVAIVFATSFADAAPCVVNPDGSCPCTCPKQRKLSRSEAAALKRHSRDAMDAYDEATAMMENALKREATKLDQLTMTVKPVKDQYGDPMYTYWGPRAYVGTPLYAGPNYPASFDRPYAQPIADTGSHYYQRGADYVTQTGARGYPAYTGSGGASQSYLQSGMVRSPESSVNSGSRPAEVNN